MMKSNSVIDITKLDYFTDQLFLDEYIDIFEGSANKLINRLKGSLKHKNSDFKDIVHTIKGLSGNIGADALREITIKAESLTDADYEKDSDRYFVRIENELAKVRVALSKCSSRRK